MEAILYPICNTLVILQCASNSCEFVVKAVIGMKLCYMGTQNFHFLLLYHFIQFSLGCDLWPGGRNFGTSQSTYVQ